MRDSDLPTFLMISVRAPRRGAREGGGLERELLQLPGVWIDKRFGLHRIPAMEVAGEQQRLRACAAQHETVRSAATTKAQQEGGGGDEREM